MAHSIAFKRAYEPPAADDGRRVLVDRMWPRGVKKEALHVEEWLKEAAPSTELRQWFNHDPARWKEFCRSFWAELDDNQEAWQPLLEAARSGKVTLVYGAKDTKHNNAVALRQYLLHKQLQAGAGAQPEVQQGSMAATAAKTQGHGRHRSRSEE